jgi:hypothetical protein
MDMLEEQVKAYIKEAGLKTKSSARSEFHAENQVTFGD